MAKKTDTVALVVTIAAATLVALFLQGFWSIVLSPGSCGGLIWYTILGVLLAAAVFYAYERNSSALWGIAVLLLLIYVALALYLTANAPSVAC